MPPPGPVTFHTHDEARAPCSGREDSAKALTNAKLGGRNFNSGVVLLPINKRAGKHLLLGFPARPLTIALSESTHPGYPGVLHNIVRHQRLLASGGCFD